MIMALDRCIRNKGAQEKSVYDERGAVGVLGLSLIKKSPIIQWARFRLLLRLLVLLEQFMMCKQSIFLLIV